MLYFVLHFKHLLNYVFAKNSTPLLCVLYGYITKSQNSSAASGSEVKCQICDEKMDEKVPCMVINRCNHIFHRACIENSLSTDQECPICKQTCELEDLRKISFPLKQNVTKGKNRPRGGLSKTYQTRGHNKNLLQESTTPLVDISGGESIERRTIPNESNSQTDPSNINSDNISYPSVPNQSVLVDYDHINKIIKDNLSRALQNFNTSQNQTIDPNYLNQAIEASIRRALRNMNYVTNTGNEQQEQVFVENLANPTYNNGRNHSFNNSQFPGNHQSRVLSANCTNSVNQRSPYNNSFHSNSQSFQNSNYSTDKITSIIQNWCL